MEGVKSHLDMAAEIAEKSLAEVREMLHKAADMKDPRNMFLAVKSALDLLALLLTPGS